MAVQLVEFLRVFAVYVAGRASLAYGGATPTPAVPWSLWLYQSVDDQAAATRTVIRPYDGELGYVPRPRAGLQFRTTGPDPASVMTQIQAVFNALLDSSGQPLRRVDVPVSPATATHRIIGVHVLQAPGLLGVDEVERPWAAFNADVDFVTIP